MSKYLELFKGSFNDSINEKTKLENKPYIGYSLTDGKLAYTVVPKLQPDNEIWYTTWDNNIVTYVKNVGITPVNTVQVSNTYNNKGIIKYSNDIESIHCPLDGHLFSENLKTIQFPNSCAYLYIQLGTVVGDGYETEFPNVISVTLPKNLVEISSFAFSDCYFTKDNFINNSSLDAEANNYWGATIVDSEIDGILFKDGVIVKVRPNITILNIPEGVTSINRIGKCPYLSFINIPNSVEYIGDYAFSGCYFAKDNFINNSSLDAEANNYWGATIVDSEIDGILIKDGVVVKGRVNITSANIPEGVTSIDDMALTYCVHLNSITIPSSMISIESGAFSGFSFQRDNFINNSSLDAEANNYWGATIYDYITEDGLVILNNKIIDYVGGNGTEEEPKYIEIPKTVSYISGLSRISNAYLIYDGTEEEWNSIGKLMDYGQNKWCQSSYSPGLLNELIVKLKDKDLVVNTYVY